MRGHRAGGEHEYRACGLRRHGAPDAAYQGTEGQGFRHPDLLGPGQGMVGA